MYNDSVVKIYNAANSNNPTNSIQQYNNNSIVPFQNKKLFFHVYNNALAGIVVANSEVVGTDFRNWQSPT
jgi:hypothetical protein